jgi:hypothetical protein
MLKKELWILIFCTFFFNCKEKKLNDIQHKIIQFNSETEREKEKCESSVYFKSTKMIRLETTENSLIVNINKIMFDEDKIFIFDQSVGSIFVFDKEGKFLYPIKKMGIGPGEYTKLNSVCLDASNKQLILFPDYPQKIYFTDYNGNLLNEVKIKNLYMHTVCNGNELYAINRLPETSNNFCFIYNIDKSSGKESCMFEKPDIFQNDIFTAGNYFMRTGKNINFTVNYENFIYEISDRKIKKKYEIDFGKYNLPGRYRQKDISINELNKACRQDGYIFSIVDVSDCDNYLAFRTNIPYIYIYSKEKDLLKRYIFITDSQYGFVFNKMRSIENTDNSVAFIIEPSSLISLKKMGKDDLAKHSINKDILQLIEGIKEDDNPVLMICEFH